MEEFEEIEVPEGPAIGRRINMNQNYDVATLKFLETLDHIELDSEGNLISGDIPKTLHKYLFSLTSKSVPLANKKYVDEYISYHQIEELVMETWDIMAKEIIKIQLKKGRTVKQINNLLRLCFIELDNMKKIAYDWESRNKEGVERRLLNTNITQSVQTADVTNKQAILTPKASFGKKLSKAFNM